MGSAVKLAEAFRMGLKQAHPKLRKSLFYLWKVSDWICVPNGADSLIRELISGKFLYSGAFSNISTQYQHFFSH